MRSRNRDREGRNDRVAVLECTIDTNNAREYTYPGYRVDESDLLSRFGGVLRQEGYVDGTTLDRVGGDGQPDESSDYVPLRWENLQSRESDSFTPGGAPWTNPHGY